MAVGGVAALVLGSLVHLGWPAEPSDWGIELELVSDADWAVTNLHGDLLLRQGEDLAPLSMRLQADVPKAQGPEPLYVLMRVATGSSQHATQAKDFMIKTLPAAQPERNFFPCTRVEGLPPTLQDSVGNELIFKCEGRPTVSRFAVQIIQYQLPTVMLPTGAFSYQAGTGRRGIRLGSAVHACNMRGEDTGGCDPVQHELTLTTAAHQRLEHVQPEPASEVLTTDAEYLRDVWVRRDGEERQVVRDIGRRVPGPYVQRTFRHDDDSDGYCCALSATTVDDRHIVLSDLLQNLAYLAVGAVLGAIGAGAVSSNRNRSA